MTSNYHTLRLILGDQLNASHSWFKRKDEQTLYLVAELKQELTYVKHHIQKVCAFLASMSEFAKALKASGHSVHFLDLDETAQYTDLESLLLSICKQYNIQRFEYQRPDEYRLTHQLKTFSSQLNIPAFCYDTEHFILPFEEINQHFHPNKHSTMEYFYRQMRQRYHILMDGDKPHGGQWNFDKQNQQKLKKEDLSQIPEPLIFSNHVEGIITRLQRNQIPTFGLIQSHLIWPINRQQALHLLDYFCQYLLPSFGQFQDAMTTQTPHKWSLYHARISFALNAKILHPLQVIQKAVAAYQLQVLSISIAQVEGFIRQILGWREFIRAVYWVNMPDYAQKNHLKAATPLPEFFWTGDTKMACLRHALTQSLEYAYAHHIQRLMVIGNFSLLTDLEPEAVESWYLGVYVDALEWVEMPNTKGMALFADGGIVATKPYAASGNYIHKMSDYCKDCHYKVKEKETESACPLNSLYWRFMDKHRHELEKNPRIGMIFRNWDRLAQDKKDAIIQRASMYLANIEQI